MDRRTFLRSTGLVAITTATGSTFLMGCAPGGDEKSDQSAAGPNATKLAFVTPFQHILNYADIYAGIQEGYFAEEGLRIEVLGGSGTASSISQVVAGQGAFGKAASVITCPLIADGGAQIITVAQCDQRSQYSLASSPENPLTQPSQWQGKTIGVISKGGSTELLLDAMSVAQGLDPTKVKKVVTGADVGSLEFLNRGSVDGFITYIGSEAAFQQRDIELHYLNTDKFAKMPGDSYLVKTKDLKPHAEDIVGFLRASRRGYKFVEDPANLDKVITAMSAYNKVEVQDRELTKLKVKAQPRICKPDSGDYLSIDMPAWESGIELMRKSGIMKDTSRPISDFVTTEFVDQI
jgi:ABC-type nitrate/sulfonate/bicarbonate transport system substrate-binding protein